MKEKLQSIDEAGRATALKRYGGPAVKSEHGHSQMDQDMRKKFESEMPKPVESKDG